MDQGLRRSRAALSRSRGEVFLSRIQAGPRTRLRSPRTRLQAVLGPWRRRGSEAHAAPASATASRVSSARCGWGMREKRRVMDPGPRTRRLPCSSSSASQWVRGGRVGSATRARRGAPVARRTAELRGSGGGAGACALRSCHIGMSRSAERRRRRLRRSAGAGGRGELPAAPLCRAQQEGGREQRERKRRPARASAKKERKKTSERACERAGRASKRARENSRQVKKRGGWLGLPARRPEG